VLGLQVSTKIFLCREAVDFRKAHDGLAAIVRDHLGEDLFAGGIFIFLNKRRDRIKLLEWDKNGLWLHYKRLEKGTFRWPVKSSSRKVALNRTELSMLLDGIELKAVRTHQHFTDSIRIHGRDAEQRKGRAAARY